MTDIDVYLNFVMHAVLGLTGEADTLLRSELGPRVDRVAQALAQRFPFAPTPIYRGMLLDSREPLKHREHIGFLSWSEDLDVARWFASTRSIISQPTMAMKPWLQGYLLAHRAENVRVLFHHSWIRATNAFGALAASHPMIGPYGAQQITWALRTQREVITAPIADLPTPIAVDVIDYAALDRKFAPPWFTGDDYGEIPL